MWKFSRITNGSCINIGAVQICCCVYLIPRLTSLLLLSADLYLLVQSFGLLIHFFYFLLSWTRVFQFGTFNPCMYFLTSTSQHIFGLPVGLFEMVWPFLFLTFFRYDHTILTFALWRSLLCLTSLKISEYVKE